MPDSRIGLYYPFLRFRNEAWLRLSVLYWDEMRRIVPSHLDGTGSDLVDELSVRGGVRNDGFIKSADPSFLRVSDKVSMRVLEFLERNRVHLRQHYSLKDIDHWKPVPIGWLDPDGGYDTLKLARVYVGKINYQLMEAMAREGIGRMDYDSSISVLMHPKLAHVLLCELAIEMGKANGFEPVADDVLAHEGAAAWTIERLLENGNDSVRTRQSGEVEAALLRVVLDAVAPAVLFSMPVKEIIDLRKECKQEFNALREWMEKLVSSWDWAQAIKDESVLSDRLKERYTQEIFPIVDHAMKKAQLGRWITFTGALGVVGAPTSLATLSGVAGAVGLTLSATPVAVAGISLYLTKIAADREKLTSDMSTQGTSFLLRLRGRQARLPKQVRLGRS